MLGDGDTVDGLDEQKMEVAVEWPGRQVVSQSARGDLHSLDFIDLPISISIHIVVYSSIHAVTSDNFRQIVFLKQQLK